MLKFWGFSNFVENSYFRVHSHGNSLLGAIFSFRCNFAERNDGDAPENGSSGIITIYNKYDYGERERRNYWRK